MKIAILGTKGIPNQYGGFEQFAEYLSVRLVKRGHTVTVYNPSFHVFNAPEFNGVRIERIFSPEKWLGGAANFLYDHLCLSHALRKDFDIIYEAGYHSVAASYKLLGVKKIQSPVLITNMDGLEWMRSKWNPAVRKLIRALEKIAVHESPFLISDNLGIQEYYQKEFSRDSFFIPYGADLVEDVNPQLLETYGVRRGEYYILVARMEPENNIEMILKGYVRANPETPFVVVGNCKNGFGQKMKKQFGSDVKFVGGVYDKKSLDSLRHFSKAYLHGHSVGGTNPSLLEAMSCNCFILAHDNPFNRGVLQEDALYFANESALVRYFQTMDEAVQMYGLAFKKNNLRKIRTIYNWDLIAEQHEVLFRMLIEKNQSVRR